MRIDRIRPRDRGLAHLEHVRDVSAQLTRQLEHAALLEIEQRRLDLLGSGKGVFSRQASAAARHRICPVQDQHAQRRVKVGVQHDARRGLALQLFQRAAPPVTGKNTKAAVLYRHDHERLLQADNLDRLGQLVNAGLRVGVVRVFLELIQRDLAHLHGVQFGHRIAQHLGQIKL